MSDNRRAFLSAIGAGTIGILAGCASNNPESTAPGSDTGDESETVSSDTTDAETTTREPTDTDTETETTSEETESETTTQEEPLADARFVVDKSGEGDYTSLQDAVRVAKKGDVIGIASGEYECELSKSVTLRGISKEETTVQLNAFSVGESFQAEQLTLMSSEDELRHTDPSPTISITDSIIEANIGTMQSDITIDSSTLNGEIDGPVFAKLVITNSTINAKINTDKIVLKGCETNAVVAFSGDAKGNRIENSTCNSAVVTPNGYGSIPDVLVCRDSEFLAGIRVNSNTKLVRCTVRGVEIAADESGGDLTAINSQLLGAESLGASILVNQHSDGRTHINIEDSTISAGESDVDYGITSLDTFDELVLTGSTVDRPIRAPTDGNDAKFKQNTFEAEGADFENFITGKPGAVIQNAFIGADIRIDSSSTTMYDAQEEIGNYYSAFDKADDNGDGIIDLPRPIPGDGDVTDRYPLASKDISNY